MTAVQAVYDAPNRIWQLWLGERLLGRLHLPWRSPNVFRIDADAAPDFPNLAKLHNRKLESADYDKGPVEFKSQPGKFYDGAVPGPDGRPQLDGQPIGLKAVSEAVAEDLLDAAR